MTESLVFLWIWVAMPWYGVVEHGELMPDLATCQAHVERIENDGDRSTNAICVVL